MNNLSNDIRVNLAIGLESLPHKRSDKTPHRLLVANRTFTDKKELFSLRQFLYDLISLISYLTYPSQTQAIVNAEKKTVKNDSSLVK